MVLHHVMAPFVHLSLLGQLTLWYVWNNGVSHSTTELSQWLCIMLWNSRTLWTRFSEKKSYHKNWRYHAYSWKAFFGKMGLKFWWSDHFKSCVWSHHAFGWNWSPSVLATNTRNPYTVVVMYMQRTVVGHTLKKHISYLWPRRFSHDHDIYNTHSIGVWFIHTAHPLRAKEH